MMHHIHSLIRVNHELTNIKGIASAYDNALFLWRDATGNLMDILAIHVDDFYSVEMICFRKMWLQNWKKYSKLECIKIEHLNFWDWVLDKQAMRLLSTKIFMFHLYPP